MRPLVWGIAYTVAVGLAVGTLVWLVADSVTAWWRGRRR